MHGSIIVPIINDHRIISQRVNNMFHDLPVQGYYCNINTQQLSIETL